MDKIKKLFDDPWEIAVAASGLALAGFYVFYARKHLFGNKQKKKAENTLDMSLTQLVNAKKYPNVVKIVITESHMNLNNFSTSIVTKLKEFLKENNQQVLVNCSPLKLFNAGAQVFINTLNQTDPDDEDEYLSYLQNSLKCQLVVQQTISDIFQIRNKGQKVFMICDTNALDLKVQTQQNDVWSKFEKISKVQSSSLRDNYTMVFHLKSNFDSRGYQNILNERENEQRSQDIKIQKAWKSHERYYPITYHTNRAFGQNIEIAMEEIVYNLKPYLPNNVTYKQKEVFVQDW